MLMACFYQCCLSGSDGRFWLQSMIDPPVQLPLRMNNTPHPREMRQFFYKDACQSMKEAIAKGELKMSLRFVYQVAVVEFAYKIGIVRIT